MVSLSLVLFYDKNYYITKIKRKEANNMSKQNLCKECTEDKSKQEVEFRELDGVYFRIQRNDKWLNICFSDLTEEEMKKVLSGRKQQCLEELCVILGKTIRKIGDDFDILTGDE